MRINPGIGGRRRGRNQCARRSVYRLSEGHEQPLLDESIHREDVCCCSHREEEVDFPVMVAGFWREPGNYGIQTKERQNNFMTMTNASLTCHRPWNTNRPFNERISSNHRHGLRSDGAFSLQCTPHGRPGPDLSSNTPNQGRKTLIFSDGRQKAAKLAKTSAEIQCWTKAERSSFRCFAGRFRYMEENTGPCHASILGSAYGRRSCAITSLKTVKGGMMEPILLTKPVGRDCSPVARRGWFRFRGL